MPKLLETGQSEVGWHRHELLLTCPQKYAFRYLMEKPLRTASGRFPLAFERTKGMDAATLGTLVHTGLAHFYLAQRKVGLEDYHTPTGAIDAQWDEMIASGVVTPDDDSLKWRAHAIYEQYVSTWEKADLENFEVIGVEQVLRTEIDGQLYTQRADLIIQREGRVYIWDHKTSGGWKLSELPNSYGMSGQIIGLSYLGRTLYGADYNGALLNIVGTRANKEGKYQFLRRPPAAAPAMDAKFEQVIRDARAIAAMNADRHPWNWPRVATPTICYAYGGCEYLDRCRFGGTLQ